MFQDPEKKPMGRKLTRDCKIKWGSLVGSIKSVLDIKPVLIDFLKYDTLAFNEEEWDLLEELYGVLSPVKDVVNVICRVDADLLEAEVVIKELFCLLESLGTNLSKKLLEALKIEIGKRWLPDHVGLLKYLNNPNELSNVGKKRPSAGKFLILH